MSRFRQSSIADNVINENSNAGLSERPLMRSNSSFYRSRTLEHLSEEKKAKRVHFYRNGDRFHQGATYAISGTRFRTFDALLTDLTRTLSDTANLPFGVRSIFAIKDWRKVDCLRDIEHGESYVCSSGEGCKKMDYLQNTTPNWSKNRQGGLKSQSLTRLTNTRLSFSDKNYRLMSERKSFKANRDFIRPKLITVIRNGVKPRKAIRILLNKKTAHSLEQVASEITTAIKLDTGAVRKIYTLAGKEVKELRDFFGPEEVFIACGYEKLTYEDFEIDSSEKSLCKSYETPKVRRRSLKIRSESDRETGRLVLSNKAQSTMSLNTVEPLIAERNYPPKLLEEFNVLSNIGDGHYASVKECMNRATGKRYALKVVLAEDSSDCRFDNETAILKQMRHPNIVRLVRDFISDRGTYFVMELANGGDLFDVISRGTKFSEDDACGMLHNIASALLYLHNRNVVHRDVKPENLLVYLYKDGTKALKLGDFGLATVLADKPLYTICGTPTYVAPEIILQKGYGLEVDIWAAGVITFILMCGSPPFSSSTDNQEELFDIIICGRLEFPSPSCDCISQSARILIQGMLQHSRTSRLTASEVLNHNWLSEGNVLNSVRESIEI